MKKTPATFWCSVESFKVAATLQSQGPETWKLVCLLHFLLFAFADNSKVETLLLRYYGQLELLELHFPKVAGTFPWRDAFTGKLTSQSTLAIEKASVLFQIAAIHSSIAASQDRSEPGGIQKAVRYSRTAAGLLIYIIDHFLHAPSTDMSTEVLRFLVDLMLAQANESFLNKCSREDQADTLISKVASQVASLYFSLKEQVKPFTENRTFEPAGIRFCR